VLIESKTMTQEELLALFNQLQKGITENKILEMSIEFHPVPDGNVVVDASIRYLD
jgi:hypothetical protein